MVRRRSQVIGAGRLGCMSAACTPRLLVLWDVDHTLIETRGVGRAIYDQAFLVATGRPMTELANVSGRTELDIMTESLRINRPCAAWSCGNVRQLAIGKGARVARSSGHMDVVSGGGGRRRGGVGLPGRS